MANFSLPLLLPVSRPPTLPVPSPPGSPVRTSLLHSPHPHSLLRPIKTPTSSLVKTPLSWRRQKGNNREEGEVKTSGKNYPVLASSSPLNQGLEPAPAKDFLPILRFLGSAEFSPGVCFFFFLIRRRDFPILGEGELEHKIK